MNKAIYKIVNKVNNKIYIGQSVNPTNRWHNHKSCRRTYIGRAISKYGVKNFDFQILEWTKDYDERERYWIDYYESYGPKGYNLTAGGEGQQRLPDEILDGIRKDIINTEFSLVELAEIYGISAQTISNLNQGLAYKEESYSYPLRYKSQALTHKDVLFWEKTLSQFSNLTIQEVVDKLDCTRTLLYLINSGKHSKSSKKYLYPIVPYDRRYATIEEVQAIEKEIKNTKTPLKHIATQFGREREIVTKIKNGKHRYSSKDLKFPLR